MANISHSSELMTQLVPESAMPHSNQFYVLHDGLHHPMIFSLGTQGTLYLVKVDPPTGKNILVDLSAKFGLTHKVVAFNVTQDQALTIYLVFVEEGDAGKGSTLHIVKPVKPTECDWNGSADLKPYLLKPNTKRDINITRIFLGTGDDGNGYPTLVLVYSNVDGTLPPNTDVARITVNTAAKSWDYLPNFCLPENARTMDDICIANVRGTRGLFTLYRIQGKKTLAFIGFPSKYGVSMTVDLAVPDGAKCLDTFINSDGFTDLVIGATKGLYYLTDEACSSSEAGIEPVLISRDGDEFLKGTSQLHIAQNQQHISVWARNGADDVVYQQFSSLSSAQISRATDTAIPLLTKKAGGGVFAAIVDPQSQLQTLLILGGSGQLSMLEQKADTGAWEPARSIDVPSTEKHSEFTSYTTHITFEDAEHHLLVNKTIVLSAATSHDVDINGIVMQIGPEGQSVTTDFGGSLTLATRSPNLDAVLITIRDVAGSVILGREYTIDPAQKVKSTLSKICSPQALENTRLKDGTLLLDLSTAKPEARQKVASAFGLLGRRLDAIEKGTNDDGSETAKNDGKEGESLVWDAWHWVSQKFDEFAGAVVRFVKGAWRFIVDIAGKLYSFVVETASQVLKAMHWLLEDVLRIPISKIISFLGFLFDWDDILYMHTEIADLLNFGLDWAAEGVDVLAVVVDKLFEDVKKTVETLTVPDEIKNKRKSAQEMRDFAKKDGKQEQEMRDHPGGNWSRYQLEHGGVKQAKGVGKDGSVEGFSALEDMLKPALNNFKATTEKFMESLNLLSDPKSNLSIGDILLLIGGDIANSIIEGARILITGVIKAFGAVIRILKDTVNFKIEIPLLSSLYRKISGGKDLTVLDATALLLAVPATLLFKLIHNKSPKAAKDPDPHPLSEFYGKTSNQMKPDAPGLVQAGIEPINLLNKSPKGAKDPDPHSVSEIQVKKPNWMKEGAPQRMQAGMDPTALIEGLWYTLMWAWKRRAEIMPIVSLVGNLWSAYSSYGEVMNPDEPPNEFMYAFGLLKGLCLFFGTIPVHPWAPKRPAPILRLLSWGSGAIYIVLKAYKVPKIQYATYAFFVGGFQALLDVIVAVKEWTATDEEYPERPDRLLMSLHTANVVFASSAKVVIPIATFLRGGNIYFNLIGWGSGGMASSMAVVVYGVECKEGIHHPIVSLLGIS